MYSVIITVEAYNERDAIMKALQSLAALNSVTNVEAVFIKNYSTVIR